MQSLFSKFSRGAMPSVSSGVFGAFVAGTTSIVATIYFGCDHLVSFEKPFGQKKDEQHDTLVKILQKNKERQNTLNTMVNLLEKHSEIERELLESARIMQEDMRKYQLAQQQRCFICRFWRFP